MTTIHPVHVYYDANGNVTEWVVSDDDGYSPSERPGMARVSIPRKTYDALPPDLSINGAAVQHDMNKACVSALLVADPARGAKLQANINAVDAKIAADALADASQKIAAAAVWNALPLAQQQAILALNDSVVVPAP